MCTESAFTSESNIIAINGRLSYNSYEYFSKLDLKSYDDLRGLLKCHGLKPSE